MALVGQIVTVSDVLMDGTVNNYIMGADANVFQTNYNSSGVMTNWSIGDDNKYLRCVETGLQGKFGDNSIQCSSFHLNQNYFRLITNVAGTPNDHPCYFIAGNTGLNNNVVLGYWDGEGDPDESNGALLINLGNSVLMGQSVHCIASNYCFIGTTCGSQQIQWSNAGRPYFGYNATNYVVSKTDLDSAISTGTSGMATRAWVSQNYQPAGSYAAADHTHNYQLPIPTDSSGFYQINITGTAGYATSAGSAMTATSALNFSTDLGPVGTGSVGTNSRYNGIYFKINGQVEIPGLWLGGNDGRQLHVGHTNYWPDVYLSGTTYHLEGNLASHSDYRIKEDIKYIKADEIKNFYYNLKPASYIMKKDKLQRHNFGFIAQDVINSGIDKNFYNGIYSYDEEEDLYSLNYFQFIPLNTLMIQEQHKEIETLKAEIAEIKELLKNK